MKLPEITPKQFKLSIPAIQHVAQKAGACDPFLWNLDNCRTPEQMAGFLKNHADQIAEKLGAWNESKLDLQKVKEWLENEPLTTDELLDIVEGEYSKSEGMTMMMKLCGANTMINEMKLELFMQIINDVSLAEVEQLYMAHNPNSYEASIQMKLAV